MFKAILVSSLAFALPAFADPCTAIPDRGPLPSYLKPGAAFAGNATYIGDGDSLCIEVGPGPENWVEVRLADFFAPELHAPGGREAKAALERVTKGKRLSCRASHRSYDRIVAVCQVEKASVGDLMRLESTEGGRGSPR